jgi:hypothetical protein
MTGEEESQGVERVGIGLIDGQCLPVACGGFSVTAEFFKR